MYCTVFVAELGDYSADDHRDHYLSEFRFIPGQPESFERDVAEMHKQHRWAFLITYYMYAICMEYSKHNKCMRFDLLMAHGVPVQ